MSPLDQPASMKRTLSNPEERPKKKECCAQRIEDQIEKLFFSFSQEIHSKLDQVSSRLENIQAKLPIFPTEPFERLGLDLPAIRDRYLFRSSEEFFLASNEVFDNIEEQATRQLEHLAFAQKASSFPFTEFESSAPFSSFNLIGHNPQTKEPKACSHDNLASFTITCRLNGQELPLPVFAVFDGHGTNGNEVSSFASSHLKEYLQKSLSALNLSGEEYEIANSLMYCTMLLDSGYRDYQQMYLREDPFSGSTALITLLTPEKIFTSCLGDSRAVLVRQEEQRHQQLSFDQGTSDPIAKRKAKKRAILHSTKHKDSSGNDQIIYRILGTNMTGALGNFHTIVPRNSSLKMLEVKPRVNVIQRTDQDLYLLLSSDGVYFAENSPSTNQVGDFLCQTKAPPFHAAEHLAQLARQAGSADDIGVTIVDLTKDYNDLVSYISGLEEEQEKSSSDESTVISSENSFEQAS